MSELAVSIIIGAAVPLMLLLPDLLALIVTGRSIGRPPAMADLRDLRERNRFADALSTPKDPPLLARGERVSGGSVPR